MEKFTMTISGEGGTADATELVQSVVWSGERGQVARTLRFPLLTGARNRNIPTVPCALGSRVRFSVEGALLFDGYVFTIQRDTGDDAIEVECFDRGVYLKGNEASYKFTNTAPEEIARRVCGDFGIPVGALAATGVRLSRNFPGVSLYKIIETAYTLAAAQTGERYMTRFKGEALEVVVKRRGPSTTVLRPGSTLLTATVTESVEQLINRVVVYDDKGRKLSQYGEEEHIRLYGLFQAYLKKSKGKDPAAEARKLLADNGPSQKVSVTTLGDTALITGDCAILEEPVTGLKGLFWIDGDSHTWKGGLYQCKLTLNFRNIMDEQSAGKE